MENSKKWYESQGVIAGAVAFLMMIVQVFDIDLDQSIVTELVTGIVGLYATVHAIYGRIRARHVITN